MEVSGEAMFSLKRLSHLIALAEERHFARAAERVHLSQPAFSRSIQAMEQEAGMRLFDRDTGEVKPTPAGQFLIHKARQLLFDARSLTREMTLYREAKLGDTAFGVGPFIAATVMCEVLPLLKHRYPGVGLKVEVSNWLWLYERLLSEDIEFFLSDVRDIPSDPRITITGLGVLPGRFYVRAGHPLLGKPRRLEELWNFGVAATKIPTAIKRALAGLLGVPNEEAVVFSLECDDVALLRAAAITTDIVLASIDSAVRGDVRSGALVPVEIEGVLSLYSDAGVVSLANRTLSPMASHVLDHIRESFMRIAH